VARKTPGTEAIRPQAQERRERFVAEYLIDRNATQAAIRAGYSEKTAYSQGCRLLNVCN
jgi:phage terminase small subunit